MKYNEIIITNERVLNNHPMLRDEHMDWLFNQAEDSYEEWLFSGGEIFDEEDEFYEEVTPQFFEDYIFDEFPF